jgi:hypothetical protein
MAVENILWLTGMAAAGVLVAWFVIAFLIDRFGTLNGSVWDPISSISYWYAAFIGGYAMYELLPKFVAHGRTRRDSAIEMAILGVIHALVLALVITVGFAIERGVFDLFGWPQGTPEDRMIDSFTNYPGIFLESLMSLAVWTVAGALIGMGFYRDSGRGSMAIVITIVLGALLSAATGASNGPLMFMVESLGDGWGTPLVVVMSLVSLVVATVVTWIYARDVPLRSK